MQTNQTTSTHRVCIRRSSGKTDSFILRKLLICAAEVLHKRSYLYLKDIKMDSSHTTNDQLKADSGRRESFGSQNSQTAKEYALNSPSVADPMRIES